MRGMEIQDFVNIQRLAALLMLIGVPLPLLFTKHRSSLFRRLTVAVVVFAVAIADIGQCTTAICNSRE